MRRFATLITTLAIAMSGLVFSPAHASVPSDGTYLCTTGVASSASPNYTITNGGVSGGNSCAGDVVIPDGVTSLDWSAFNFAESLTSINIPSTVTTIDDNAFYFARSLTSINIPASVTTIGDSAFEGASSLSSITVDPANAYYSSIEGVLFNKAATTLITYPIGIGGTSYSIPSGVRSIGARAFEGVTSLTDITIPFGVTRIGDRAFRSATSLSSVTIPESVTSIGDGAFYDAESLTSIAIPASVTSIGGAAFSCTFRSSLTSITVDSANAYYRSTAGVLFSKSGATLIQYPVGNLASSYSIPPKVRFIGGNAFYRATSLTSITIPANVFSIGDSAFVGTKITSINLPASVYTIGSNAFQSNTLTSINIPANVYSIGDDAFGGEKLASITVAGPNRRYRSIGGVLFNKAATTLITYPRAIGATSYSIPFGVTTIGIRAFIFAKLTKITIPSSVSTIGQEAFVLTTSLTSINIPESVTVIGDDAFGGASSLTTITIPESVRSIGERAFQDASELKNIVFLGNAPVVDETSSSFGNVAPGAKAFINRGATGFSRVGSMWNGLTVAIMNQATSTVKPTISGAPNAGKVLTASKGTWTGYPAPTFTYQWYACDSGVNSAVDEIPKSCKIIANATTSTLAVTNSFKGKYLAVAVAGTSAGTSPTKWVSKSTAKVS